MTAITAVLLWLLLLAVLANFLRRLPWLPGVVVAIGLALLAVRLWQLPETGSMEWLGQTIHLDRAIDFFGFKLQMTPSSVATTMILIEWGILFALAGAWLDADRVLFPAIPLILAALILAVGSQPLLWAPLWLVVAAIFMAFPAQGATPRLARAALRLLLAPILAFPFFLFTAWVLNQPTIAVDDPALWTNAWRSLVIGVALLLTPVPLHGWITSQGENAPPFTAAFLVGVWQLAVYTLVRNILLTYPELADYADPVRWLPWIAVIQMGWGALFGLSSNRSGQLWGYLLLWDYGATFLLWSLSGEFGTQTMVWMFLVRPLVLVTIAAGFQSLSKRFGENTEYRAFHGVSERLPVSMLALVGGGLFLLGWPLGALFPARLSTWRLAEATQPTMFLWAMAALFLMSLGLIRLLRALTQPLTDTDLQRESSRLIWLVLPLLFVGLIISLNPSLLNSVTLQLTEWLATL